MTVGILGMAFKGGSDDPRNSLSYELHNLLYVRAESTACSDVHIVDERFVSAEQLLGVADLIIVATPHPEYCDIKTDKPVVDLWGITGRPPIV